VHIIKPEMRLLKQENAATVEYLKRKDPLPLKLGFTNLDAKSPLDRLLTHAAILNQQKAIEANE
jgi:hypothetical protein